MKAVITAGGKGTRLYPVTRAYPKELIQFCGVPVIEYGINLLKKNGIKDIIVVTGTKKGALQDYLGNGDIFGVNIAYIIQEQPKGLGHAVQIVEPYVNHDFILLLGDNILVGDCGLKEMIEIHKRNNALSTILVEYNKEPEKYGVVKLENINSRFSRIISVFEKPKEEKIKNEFKIDSGWYVISGLYILNKKIFNFLRKVSKDYSGEIQLTDAIKLSLDAGSSVFGNILNGRRIDIGNWNYIKDEREFYINMNDDKLNDIINVRNQKMEYNRTWCGAIY